jgi:hypothetical protein
MEVELLWLLTAPSLSGRYRANGYSEAHKKAGSKKDFRTCFFIHCIWLYLNVFVFDCKQYQFNNILRTRFLH